MAKIDIKLSKKMYCDLFMGNFHYSVRKFIKNAEDYEVFSKFRNQSFVEYYSGVQLFSGISNFIKKIFKSYSLFIVSSGENFSINRLLDSNKIKSFFSEIYTGSGNSKEGQINIILEKLKIFPEEAIMISDTYGDLILAKKLNLKTVGVSWGFHSSKEIYLAQPDCIVEDLSKLYYFLIKEV